MTRLDTEPTQAQSVRVTQTRTFPIPGEDTLATDIRAVLQRIGTALDQHRPLRVRIDGLIAVDEEPLTATRAQETGDEGQGTRGPAARPRERAARRQGAARRSRPSGAASRIGGNVLRDRYEGQVRRLAEAYPTLQTFPDEDGTWLFARSSIISGLTREATFLVALPYRSGPGPRAWGFWTAAAQPPMWIGPRHTNFGDGSVCAFSPNEGAWSEGGDLQTLFDLYSVWALRHLHLEVLGRWPGKQYGLVGADARVQAYYRQVECKDDELCGCGSETRRYADCCKASDLRWDFVESATLFLHHVHGGFCTRQPPNSVVHFIKGQSAIPKMADVHQQLHRADCTPA